MRGLIHVGGRRSEFGAGGATDSRAALRTIACSPLIRRWPISQSSKMALTDQAYAQLLRMSLLA